MEQTYYTEEREPRSDYAGIFRRFLALLIDWFLLGIAFFGLRLLLPSLWADDAGWFSGRNVIEFILAFAYFAYFDSDKKGGTFGKQATSMQVLGEDDRPLPLPKSAIRSLAKLVFGWIPLVWLMPLISRRRQALHDMVVKSFVMDDSLHTRTWR